MIVVDNVFIISKFLFFYAYLRNIIKSYAKTMQLEAKVEFAE